MLRSILAVKIPAVKRAGIQTWSKNSVYEMAQRIAGYVNLQDAALFVWIRWAAGAA
ncbi:hypothetical protein CLOSTASPAR_06342 [[Clostridium] asparagiforme DSM 15981]|uniref:Uncharacterized protein n=1 Tax=[Clostridium] asparagiforme DSM 15981 TaxID=518636 RepID=C0DAN9_9FIRM|nr:hypothetical protein CLOSTASPAR_06342 [[Clostridium] asparagiforme DSM 15981]